MNNKENKIIDLPENINLNNQKKSENENINKIAIENKQEFNDKTNQKKENENKISEKGNEIKNNDNQESNNNQKNVVIDQFLEEMENNKENKENIKQNKKEDEKSDDPFLKAEKEYRIKNNKNEDKKIKIQKNIKKDNLHNMRHKTVNFES